MTDWAVLLLMTVIGCLRSFVMLEYLQYCYLEQEALLTLRGQRGHCRNIVRFRLFTRS